MTTPTPTFHSLSNTPQSATHGWLDYRKTRCEVVHMERTMSSGFAIGQFRELTDRKSLLSRNTNDHRRRSRLQHVAR
ncbi:hypothetical protein Y032_0608g594 [Ancylostoma ceylanicum]|uniref:Uncharacterized protein n=1 Tax=Ancylostoma ceylanicum TaxID=53326 RepID=A0A016WL45_9BILA|nr:hypothetical protein Y032_0608g594 [Ancylostoma ceylanicum]